MGETELSVVDLFAGAGGLSCGFVQEGFKVVHASDHDPAAVHTYRANLGDHVELLDLSQEVDLPAASVIAGGPPCQAFSSAGRRRPDDERSTLVARFAEIVASARPAAFVYENVEGFLTIDGGARVFDLLDPLIEAGYRVHARKVNAATYGVPQHRKRVLVIGGLGWDPDFPEPTHAAYGAPGAHLGAGNRPPAPTLDEALDGLEAPSLSPPGDPADHVYRELAGLELERATQLAPGQRMRDLPERFWHDSYRRRAYRRVMDGTPTERRGGAPAGVRRLRGDEPSKAITGGARSEFLHPSEDRFLTLRECARIQTFPDDFLFQGTMSERAILIGNAVPPVLAAAIARAVAQGLRRVEPAHDEGTLLSFVPTPSGGMSPALAGVVRSVEQRYQPVGSHIELALWG